MRAEGYRGRGASVACDLNPYPLLLKEKGNVSVAAPLRFGKIVPVRSLLSFRRGGQEVRSRATDVPISDTILTDLQGDDVGHS
jgi:hypothetical protein